MSQTFGKILGRHLHAEHCPELIARTLHHTEVAVVELRSEHPTQELSDPLPPEDAFVVTAQLRDYPVHEWWEDGRQAPVVPLKAGDTTLCDLRRDPRFRINNPFHSIHFRLPHKLLDALADETGAKRIVELEYTSGVGNDDVVVSQLARLLQPYFVHPTHTSRLFVDYVTSAIAAHVAVTYGQMGKDRIYPRGGLSAWQQGVRSL